MNFPLISTVKLGTKFHKVSNDLNNVNLVLENIGFIKSLKFRTLVLCYQWLCSSLGKMTFASKLLATGS